MLIVFNNFAKVFFLSITDNGAEDFCVSREK